MRPIRAGFSACHRPKEDECHVSSDLDRSWLFGHGHGFAHDPIEAAVWSFLTRDGIHLMLGECPKEVDAGETGNHSWFLHVMVEGIDELHREVTERGADVVVPLVDRSHGHREFVVRTPDGHRILFGEPIA